MQKVLLLSAIILLSQPVFADDTTTTETCANGAGRVITGVVSGHKYCRSNNTMDWWNAHTWCDGLGSRLFSMNDCEHSSTNTLCNELAGVGGNENVWTAMPKGTSLAYNVNLSSGYIGSSLRGNHRCAVCY